MSWSKIVFTLVFMIKTSSFAGNLIIDCKGMNGAQGATLKIEILKFNDLIGSAKTTLTSYQGTSITNQEFSIIKPNEWGDIAAMPLYMTLRNPNQDFHFDLVICNGINLWGPKIPIIRKPEVLTKNRVVPDIDGDGVGFLNHLYQNSESAGDAFKQQYQCDAKSIAELRKMLQIECVKSVKVEVTF